MFRRLWQSLCQVHTNLISASAGRPALGCLGWAWSAFTLMQFMCQDISHNENRQHSFAILSLKLNGQKNMGVHDRISSGPAISKQDMPSGVRRRSLSELDTLARSIRACIKQIFVLTWEKPWDHHLFQQADQLRRRSRPPPPCLGPHPHVTSCCKTSLEATTCSTMTNPMHQHATTTADQTHMDSDRIVASAAALHWSAAASHRSCWPL
jgi:hypothetical protein